LLKLDAVSFIYQDTLNYKLKDINRVNKEQSEIIKGLEKKLTKKDKKNIKDSNHWC
jgi:hypothetical protein